METDPQYEYAQSLYWACADLEAVAVVPDLTDPYAPELYDYTYNWQSAQNYALAEGRKVVVIRADEWSIGDMHFGMAAKDIQALCDAEYERYADCFGIVA